MKVVHNAGGQQPENKEDLKNDEVKETALPPIPRVQRFLNYVRSAFGAPVNNAPATNQPATEPPVEEAQKLYKYKFEIHGKGGVVKGSINAANAEAAKQDIVVDYVRQLKVRVELVGEA